MNGFVTHNYRFINYKELNEEDSRLVWKLRNEPGVTQWMVNDSFIPWESHRRFVESLKTDKDRDYFIIRDVEDRLIGSVNILRFEEGLVERGIYINPVYWNKGHAGKSMMEFYAYLKTQGIKGIITKVKINNLASIALEEKLKSRLTDIKEGYNFYFLEL